VTNQALGGPLIEGELNGEIGDQRQDKEKRHRGQQHQTIDGYQVPRTHVTGAKMSIAGIGFNHG
jgi:hypothetical protein